MKTPRIEEIVEKIVDTVETVEFLHGVPVKLPSQYKADLRGKARQALTKAHQAGKDEAVEEIRNEVGGFIAGVYAMKFNDNSREAKFWDVWKDGYEQCRKDALNAIEYESKRQN